MGTNIPGQINQKREILNEMDRAFRETAGPGKRGALCVGVDENGAYRYEIDKKHAWDDERDVVIMRPLPDSFRIPSEALELLLGEMASPEELEKLMPLETLSLAELRACIDDAGLYARLLEEIIQMSGDEAGRPGGEFENLLDAWLEKMGNTATRNVSPDAGGEGEDLTKTGTGMEKSPSVRENPARN